MGSEMCIRDSYKGVTFGPRSHKQWESLGHVPPAGGWGAAPAATIRAAVRSALDATPSNKVTNHTGTAIASAIKADGTKALYHAWTTATSDWATGRDATARYVAMPALSPDFLDPLSDGHMRATDTKVLADMGRAADNAGAFVQHLPKHTVKSLARLRDLHSHLAGEDIVALCAEQMHATYGADWRTAGYKPRW